MLQQPTDYSFASTPPSESLISDFRGGYGIAGALRQNKDAQIQAQQEAERRARFEAAWQKATSPGATSRDMANAIMLSNPEKTEFLQSQLNQMTSERRNQVAGQAGAIYMAADSGNKDLTKQLVERLAEEQQNAGRTDMANFFHRLAATADHNLDFVKMNALPYLVSSPEGLEVFDKILERQALMQAANEAGQNISAMEEKIQALMRDAGYTREQAVKEVTGAVKTIGNPETGDVLLVEPATGSVDALSTNESENLSGDLPNLPEGQQSLWDIAKDSRVTGVASGIAQGAQRTIGSVVPGVSLMNPELQVKIERFTKVQNDLTRSFRQGDRFTATEQKRLLEELNIEPGMFTDIQTLRAKLTSVYNYLESLAEQNLQKASNTRLPAKERGIAASKYSDIIQSMALVGNPREDDAGPPEGIDPDVWEAMTEEERALF